MRGEPPVVSMSDAILTSVLGPLAGCVAELGTPAFYPPLLMLLHEQLLADQCMLFRYDDNDVQCLLSSNLQMSKRGRQLARAYIEEGYRDDPLQALWRERAVPGFALFYLDELRPEMSADYRRRFFDAVGLTDKVAVLVTDGDSRWCLNLYRRRGRPSFRAYGCGIGDGIGELLVRLLMQHYRASPQMQLEGPLAILSEREREVCSGILAGRKAEAIAADCDISANSVVTYRRRAYRKLGINSRAELFALCNRRG